MIVLVGMPGCGKTTIARMYSKTFSIPHFDTDQLLVERYGDPLGQEPTQEHWRAFRALEELTVSQLVPIKIGIVSLGGGGWESAKTQQVLLKNHLCVYLYCSIDILNKRMEAGRRVMFHAESKRDQLEGLFTRREPNYRRAHLVLDASEECSQHIVNRLASCADGW